MPTDNNLIALDCDGVLLDYNAAYPGVWRRAFGEELPPRNPACYHAAGAFGVKFTDPEVKARFYNHFDEEAWSTMPSLPGALQACHRLVELGFELVCVSSMPSEFAAARLTNLRALEFPIDTVIATGRHAQAANPKLEDLNRLQPVAFVDDLAHNFAGLPPGIHKALIERGHVDSPNLGYASEHDSQHTSLSDFVDYWQARLRAGSRRVLGRTGR